MPIFFSYVRKSIEQHKRGVNRKVLGRRYMIEDEVYDWGGDIYGWGGVT